MQSVPIHVIKALNNSLSGIGLTTWWTTEQERHLAVGNGLLGEIIVDNDSVFPGSTSVRKQTMLKPTTYDIPVITEPLAGR